MRARRLRMLLLVVIAPFATLFFADAGLASTRDRVAPSAPPGAITYSATTIETISPDVNSDESTLAPSGAQRDAAAAGLLAQRERLAAVANVGFDRPGRIDLTQDRLPETKLAAEQETAQVKRNFVNTVAQSVSDTLAEPAAAADGKFVVFGGNTYVSLSDDAGASWTQEAVPTGPVDAPIACCDSDVVYSPTTDTTFNSIIYTNEAIPPTNGVVRIWVRQGNTTPKDCTYKIDPGGSANNLVPDYPHIALSDNFLYLSTNNITSGSWSGAQMRRFNLSQMSNCAQNVTTDVFTYFPGATVQRVHVPVEGATSVMYWGSLDSDTSFRAFSWPESTTVVSQTTKTINASAFANPDCRGGTGNFDFIERDTAFSIAGFRMRGATGGGLLTFLWPSSPIGSQTQAHLRGITLDTFLNLVGQPVVFSNSFCMSYPALSSNSSGSLGLSVAYGGKAGGGGSAAQGAIAVDDSDSAGVFFPTLLLTAAGTHNRSDNRFGDYFTVRKSSRCANTWVGTNYALNGGNTNSSHVNARYIEFQSDDQPACPAPK